MLCRGLPIDIHCKPKHAKCVRKAVEAFAKTSDKNILISWKHGPMTDIAGALGVEDPPIYPITEDDSEYEWIWIIDNHDMVSNTTSQGCPGLDVPYELGV